MCDTKRADVTQPRRQIGLGGEAGQVEARQFGVIQRGGAVRGANAPLLFAEGDTVACAQCLPAFAARRLIRRFVVVRLALVLLGILLGGVLVVLGILLGVVLGGVLLIGHVLGVIPDVVALGGVARFRGRGDGRDR